MRIAASIRFLHIVLLVLAITRPAGAQIIESVGSRAQGMGGAFVAVADDSSATWWNPAGLAAGPFFDMALAKNVTEQPEAPAAWREQASWFALGTPPFGVSYYRLRITDIQASSPTVAGGAGRQDGGAGVFVRPLDVSQLGATLVRSIASGVHVGTTLKWERGEPFENGNTSNQFDLDFGALAIGGPVRIGFVARNLREADFEGLALPRQVRLGFAYDASGAGGPPLTVAFDADLQSYPVSGVDRRVLAVGAEQWLFAKRVGIRGGARFNREGAEDRTATFGLSVSPRAGLYLDGNVVHGGAGDDEGWGVAARVSF